MVESIMKLTFQVLASSMKLEYPMNDSLPNIEHARDRLLTKLYLCRKQESEQNKASDEDFEILYAYGMICSPFFHALH